MSWRRHGRRPLLLLRDAAEQLIQRLRVSQQIEIVGNHRRRRGGRSCRRTQKAVAFIQLLLLLLLLRLPGEHGLAQCHLQVGNSHDLRVGIGHLASALLLRGLAHQVLEDGHHLLVLEEGLAAGLGLLLGRQQDHEGGLTVLVDGRQLLLLLLLALVVFFSRLLLRRQVRRPARLNRLDLGLDDVLQILRN